MGLTTDRLLRAINSYRRIATAQHALDQAIARNDLNIQALTQKEKLEYIERTGVKIPGVTTQWERKVENKRRTQANATTAVS